MRERIIFLFAGLIVLIIGCATPKVEKDHYLDKWKTYAKGHLGSSPKATISAVDIEKGLHDEKKKIKKIEKKDILPKIPVTLKMRDASIKAIIHALAKTANVNIITTQNIKGRIDVDIVKQPWDQVFLSLLKSHGLTYSVDGKIIRVVSKEDLAAELAVESIEAKKQEQAKAMLEAAPLLTRVIKINFADAEKLQKLLMGLLTKDKKGKTRGNILVDSHTNSLVISAIEPDLKKIMKLIKVLDKPTNQIHLKAYIVEANKNVARELGIQWGGRWATSINGINQLKLSGPVSSSSETGGTSTSTDTFGTGKSDTGFGVQFPISSIASPSSTAKGGGLNILIGNPAHNILEMQLSALEEKGQVHILSSPSLTTLDNQMAFTESGQKVPYVTIDEDGNREVEFEDAVLRLEVTPHVIADKYLKMDIKVKKDEVDFSRTVDGNPTINKKETQTSLVVSDGETIVISGLSKQTLRDTVSGIPVLKDLPLFGYLFKGDSKSREFEDILIFITPTILKNKDRLEQELLDSGISLQDVQKIFNKTGDKKAANWLKKSTGFIKKKNWDEVLRCAQIAVDLDPGQKKAYYNISLAYYNKNKLKDALFYINRALLLDSNFGYALNLKGQVLEKLGYLNKALKFYEKGCAIDFKEACENHKRLFYLLKK
ncbi:type IV pilus secretin PilQ [Desulfothermus naphthae]